MHEYIHSRARGQRQPGTSKELLYTLYIARWVMCVFKDFHLLGGHGDNDWLAALLLLLYVRLTCEVLLVDDAQQCLTV
jgi:hypothetical protein